MEGNDWTHGLIELVGKQLERCERQERRIAELEANVETLCEVLRLDHVVIAKAMQDETLWGWTAVPLHEAREMRARDPAIRTLFRRQTLSEAVEHAEHMNATLPVADFKR